jgi:hypothetical protein
MLGLVTFLRLKTTVEVVEMMNKILVSLALLALIVLATANPAARHLLSEDAEEIDDEAEVEQIEQQSTASFLEVQVRALCCGKMPVQASRPFQ